MKAAISSYSFQWAINQGTDTQETVIARAAALGVQGVEFTDLCPPAGVRENDYADRLRAKAAAHGLSIVAYTVAADLLQEDLDTEVARIQQKVDVAARMGAPLLRHDATFRIPAEGFESVLPRLADACRRITAYAATRGVRTMVENHGYFCQDAARMEALCRAINHPNFGLLVDVGNFLCVDENPLDAVRRTAPYAFHVHIKDFLIRDTAPSDGWIPTRGGSFLRGTVAGHGMVPIDNCVTALKAAGYDGWLSLEFEGWERLEEALVHGTRFLKTFCE